MKFDIQDLKVYLSSLFGISVTLSDVDQYISIGIGVLTLFYITTKYWFLLRDNKNKE